VDQTFWGRRWTLSEDFSREFCEMAGWDAVFGSEGLAAAALAGVAPERRKPRKRAEFPGEAKLLPSVSEAGGGAVSHAPARLRTSSGLATASERRGIQSLCSALVIKRRGYVFESL